MCHQGHVVQQWWSHTRNVFGIQHVQIETSNQDGYTISKSDFINNGPYQRNTHQEYFVRLYRVLPHLHIIYNFNGSVVATM